MCRSAARAGSAVFEPEDLTVNDPGIEDLAPTALHLFGLEAPAWMEGRPVVAG
jgi:bisphosphoglycerate-independent phosphoglycerate mutase (AlkP superfamily)